MACPLSLCLYSVKSLSLQQLCPGLFANNAINNQAILLLVCSYCCIGHTAKITINGIVRTDVVAHSMKHSLQSLNLFTLRTLFQFIQHDIHSSFLPSSFFSSFFLSSGFLIVTGSAIAGNVVITSGIRLLEPQWYIPWNCPPCRQYQYGIHHRYHRRKSDRQLSG